jgi:hypothetical protein
VGGLDHDLRCEATVDAGERTMRVLTTLPPFLRLDADVGVVLDGAPAEGTRGVISRIAVDPNSRDGVPRLALDVDLDTNRAGAQRDSTSDERAPPSGLPRPYRHPLPSVLLSRAFAHQLTADVPTAAAPRRRRSQGTAEIARRFTDAGARVLATPSGDLTKPVTLAMTPLAARSLSVAWLAVPIMVAAVALAFFARLVH